MVQVSNKIHACPGCSHAYIGKTERSLETRLSEHATINSYKTSVITQHLLNCPDTFYLATLHAFLDLDSSEEFPDKIVDLKLPNNYPYFCNTSWAHAFLHCASLDWLTTSCQD